MNRQQLRRGRRPTGTGVAAKVPGGLERVRMAPHILELQSLAGNTAVTGLLRSFSGPRIARTVDAQSPDAVPAALDDPSFNAESITHDLVRAINQNDHTFVWEDGAEVPEKERRKVEFPKVAEVLSSRTPLQIAEIEKRYHAFEGRDLTFDLFEGGESNRKSSLTEDQTARIKLLLKGTRGEPIPNELDSELKAFPPDIAAQLRASLAGVGNVGAAMHQLEADAIEVHELLFGELDEPNIERLMRLYRRSVKEITGMEAFFAQRYGGPYALQITLSWRLSALQRSRLEALRQGDAARADAYAIEIKRQKIEELNKKQAAATEDLGNSWVADGIREKLEKEKSELSGQIESILDANRREALKDPANAGKSSGQAVAERLNKILGQRVGESGATLDADLSSSLGREHANIIASAADSWNTSGSASLIESAAAELVAMEKDHTTTAVRIVDTLKSFRELALHDLKAHAMEPSTRQEEKEAILKDPQRALDDLAHKYIADYRIAYDRQRGGGRTYDEIVDSASNANQTYIAELAQGGGHARPELELRHAIDTKDTESIKKVLREQPGREGILALEAAYNKLDGGRNLRKELFGVLPEGSDISPEEAAVKGMGWVTHALVNGRDAAQIREQLDKPAEADLKGNASAAEVKWVAQGGELEYQATMDNRGATGHIREWGGDPETEELLKASHRNLAELRAQWEAATTPQERQHLLLEIRKERAALTGDAEAYEKDNERVLGEIRSLVSFAVQIALAVAIPGAGPGLVAFIETTAINIAANVAANVVIRGGEYGWADLKGDVLGGVMGAAGGKFGEELLGRVANKVSSSIAKETAGAAEKVGIETVLAADAARVAAEGERISIAAEEFEAREVATEVAKPSLLEKGAREVGGFAGGIAGGKVASGDFSLSSEEVLQNLVVLLAGKAAHRQKGGHGGTEEERATTHEEERVASEEPKPEAEPKPERAAAPSEQPVVNLEAARAGVSRGLLMSAKGNPRAVEMYLRLNAHDHAALAHLCQELGWHEIKTLQGNVDPSLINAVDQMRVRSVEQAWQQTRNAQPEHIRRLLPEAPPYVGSGPGTPKYNGIRSDIDLSINLAESSGLSLAERTQAELTVRQALDDNLRSFTPTPELALDVNSYVTPRGAEIRPTEEVAAGRLRNYERIMDFYEARLGYGEDASAWATLKERTLELAQASGTAEETRHALDLAEGRYENYQGELAQAKAAAVASGMGQEQTDEVARIDMRRKRETAMLEFLKEKGKLLAGSGPDAEAARFEYNRLQLEMRALAPEAYISDPAARWGSAGSKSNMDQVRGELSQPELKRVQVSQARYVLEWLVSMPADAKGMAEHLWKSTKYEARDRDFLQAEFSKVNVEIDLGKIERAGSPDEVLQAYTAAEGSEARAIEKMKLDADALRWYTEEFLADYFSKPGSGGGSPPPGAGGGSGSGGGGAGYMPDGEQLRQMVYTAAEDLIAHPEVQEVVANLFTGPLQPGERLAPQEGVGLLGTADYFRETQGYEPDTPADDRFRNQGYVIGDSPARELQQLGTRNAFVADVGTYLEIQEQIAFELDSLPEIEGRHPDQAMAEAVQQFLRGDGTPEWIRATPDAGRLFGGLTVLFQREIVRNPATAAFLEMTLTRITSGETTFAEAFASATLAGNPREGGTFPMSMVGAQGASAELIGEREGVYGPRSPDAHELAQRETELALGWLESEMHAAGIDSFKDAEHARAFIEQRLRDRLHASYGLEPASAM